MSEWCYASCSEVGDRTKRGLIVRVDDGVKVGGDESNIVVVSRKRSLFQNLLNSGCQYMQAMEVVEVLVMS